MIHAEEFDTIIIGGGINGAGIARDAARRGLRVLLLERNDFGSGTSSWSSRLIHGGLRYLEYGEVSLVYESLHDRRALLKTAAHLVEPLKITIPIYRGGKRGKWIIRAGLLAYDLLSFGKELPNHKMQSVRETLDLSPGLETDGLIGSASYHDAQVTYAERLVIENILDAQRHGARCLNYAEVRTIHRADHAVTGVSYFDESLGALVRASAPSVVNAAGPWVDGVLDGVEGAALPDVMGGTKGSHMIVDVFKGFSGEALYSEARADGRPFFILPWNGQVLVGTTDIRDDTDPGELRASAQELDYLLAEVNTLFPEARLERTDINHTYAGMRPLPRQTDGPESAITRAHEVRHHRKTARGLYSIIGGKLTTFRSLALDVMRQIERDLGLKLPKSDTATAPLPGSPGDLAIADIQDKLSEKISAKTQARLVRVYGKRAPAVVAGVSDETDVIAAEVKFAVDEEHARNIEDILCRRSMLGLGPDRGRQAAGPVARELGNLLGWSAAECEQAEAAYVEKVNRQFRHGLGPLT